MRYEQKIERLERDNERLREELKKRRISEGGSVLSQTLQEEITALTQENIVSGRSPH